MINKEVFIGIIGMVLITVLFLNFSSWDEYKFKIKIPKPDVLGLLTLDEEKNIASNKGSDIVGNVIVQPNQIPQQNTLTNNPTNQNNLVTNSTTPPAGSNPGGNPTGPGNNQNQLCLNNFNVDSEFDYRETRLTLDDIVFIKFTNNDLSDYNADIFVDNNYDGSVFLKSLTQNILASTTITKWWRSLNGPSSKTFNIIVAVPGCNKGYDIIINYPPSDDAYYD